MRLTRKHALFLLSVALVPFLGACPDKDDDTGSAAGDEDCGDGLDNGGDGATDCQDSECSDNAICAERCGDGLDNDFDSLLDCQDPDCTGNAACVEQCGDGIDNDYDGRIDCVDEDCSCVETCDDGLDNDQDGQIDCTDSDCTDQPSCLEDCSDQIDNDGDGQLDCSDSDCDNNPVCIEDCDDGIDNDFNGLLDCEDPDCYGDLLGCSIYAADGRSAESGNLYRVNPFSGVVSVVGPIGHSVTGLAFAPDGRLFATESTRGGSTADARLLLIDPLSGVGTPVGQLMDANDSFVHQQMPDITFVGNQLLGWTETGDYPVQIDITSGQVQSLGSFLGSYGSGMAADASGQVLIAPEGTLGNLYSVDPILGSTVPVATLSGGNHDVINSMTFLQGQLYGTDAPNTGLGNAPNLVRIDPVSGVITPVMALPTAIDAIAAPRP